MSNSDRSDQEPEVEVKDSVFDFIYADHSRIATFLSQFNDFGDLVDIAHGRSATRGKSDTGQVKAQANAIVVKGDAGYTAETNAQHSETNQKTYNPRWVNVLSFLDEIDQRNMLNRYIVSSRFGDLVMVSGSLSIRDFGTLEKLWQMPSIKNLMAQAGNSSSGNRAEKRRVEKAKKKIGSSHEDASEFDIFFDLVKALPHPVQLQVGSNPTAWGVLSEGFLVSSASDFTLKFGGPIAGEWTVVGILDAVPDVVELPDVEGDVEIDQVASGFLAVIEPLTRQLLGRPEDAYGITPLVVFREVGA